MKIRTMRSLPIHQRNSAIKEKRAVREAVVVRTKEGKATARPGDWVVEAPTGERWPVRDVQFKWSYRPALPEKQSTPAATSSSTPPTISS